METDRTVLRAWGVVLLLLLALQCLPVRAADDVVARARQLAYSDKQHRAEALALLEQHLAESQDDTEARVLYGIVLSWQGRYDDARAQLAQVLVDKPLHGDALPALINVEFWSGHPQRAATLAEGALAQHPDDVSLLLADARALRDLNRRREALKVIDHVLSVSPGNREAKALRRSLAESGKWETSVTHYYDWFSDSRAPQQETSFSFRAPTPVGGLVGRVNRADRYSLSSYQTEMDFYPHFRSRTYAYLNFGYSADGNLYPSYRAGGDLFQSMGHGWEVSGGFRRLAFSTGVNIYTFALAKYYGDWLFTARGFVTPGPPGTSGTALVSARRFFGSVGQHDFLEVRYSHGASPAFAETVRDIEVLDSSRFTVEFDKQIRGGWFASFGGAVSQEERIALEQLRRYSVSGALAYRF